MEPFVPWELPVQVIHPVTRHVVGRVYRDGLFIVFERIGEPCYDLKDNGTVMHAAHDLFLRLTSDSPSLGLQAWGKRLKLAIFDECLCGAREWAEEEPVFTRMRLPCNNVMAYMGTSPIGHDWKEDGSIVGQNKAFDGFHFKLPQIAVSGYMRFGCDWSHETFVEQKFTARAELVLEYGSPTALSVIKEHEETLRSFFDFIWFRAHRSGVLYLHIGEDLAKLHRRESVSPEIRAASCLDVTQILTDQPVANWLERWFTLSIAQRLAIEPVVSIARNPGIITDMKMVMSVHALDALLKATTKVKGGATEVRFVRGLAKWWEMKGNLTNESLKEYVHRIIATRNLVLKASRNEMSASKPLLTTHERPRAFFEMLLLHRALFLELMGVPSGTVDSFVSAGFGKIRAQEFRYFRD